MDDAKHGKDTPSTTSMGATLVDARGLACPQPVVLTSKALTQAPKVTVVVDNIVAAENVTRLARSKRCTLTRTDRSDGIWLELVAPSQGPGPAPSPSQGSTPQGAAASSAPAVSSAAQPSSFSVEGVPLLSCTPGPTPVMLFIPRNTLGDGPPELGERLMTAFLHTLLEAEPKPQAIIFMNKGVHLAVEGSPCLDDLQALLSKGVDIIACGTCLGFFGLTEKLRAGRISNMYEIATLLLGASRVVTL